MDWLCVVLSYLSTKPFISAAQYTTTIDVPGEVPPLFTVSSGTLAEVSAGGTVRQVPERCAQSTRTIDIIPFSSYCLGRQWTYASQQSGSYTHDIDSRSIYHWGWACGCDGDGRWASFRGTHLVFRSLQSRRNPQSRVHDNSRMFSGTCLLPCYFYC